MLMKNKESDNIFKSLSSLSLNILIDYNFLDTVYSKNANLILHPYFFGCFQILLILCRQCSLFTFFLSFPLNRQQ